MLLQHSSHPSSKHSSCSHSHCSRRQPSVSHARRVRKSGRANAAPPTSAAEVVSWAQQQFLSEVSPAKPDGCINLAKVCMLLALEEEAAKQLGSAPSATARTSATASTWSLQRLAGLAAEVVDHLTALEQHTYHHQQQQQTPPAADSSTPPAAAGSVGSAATISNSSSSSSSAAFDVRQQAQRFPMQVLSAVNAVLFQRHGYSACNRYGSSVDSELSVVLEEGPGSVAALTILYMEVCARLGLSCGVKVVEDGRYCLVWPQPAPSQQQHQQQVGESASIAASQEQQQHPQQQQQPVSQQQTLLSIGGEACVIDVYGEGAVLPVKEACELFEVTPQELLAGSSRRELLASLLTELQTAHWCSAIGCSPSPALMTPLTAGTAVRQVVRQLNGASIERAAAAASKRVALLPQDTRAQLDLALLCYFSGRYEDAWLELGCHLEQLKAAAEREEQQQQQEQQQGTIPHGQQQSQAATASGAGGGSSSSSSSVSRVTELHAAIQSMLIGGAPVPEPLLPSAAAAAAAAQSQPSAAAEAALASADEDDADSKARRQQDQELSDIVLLFQKLQLELMMTADRQS